MKTMRGKALYLNLLTTGMLCLLMLPIPNLAVAAGPEPATEPSWIPKLLGAQVTGIYQYMPTFTSPYEGGKSLRMITVLDGSLPIRTPSISVLS